jgi:hypothetical protein
MAQGERALVELLRRGAFLFRQRGGDTIFQEEQHRFYAEHGRHGVCNEEIHVDDVLSRYRHHRRQGSLERFLEEHRCG